MLEASGFWRGRLRIWQPARKAGYRFNLDAVLLAAFCPPARQVCDLGAGCGIVGLLLLRARRAQQVWAVERQPLLVAAARANVACNGLSGRMWVLSQDLRSAPLPRSDLVVFNPPYFCQAQGRASPTLGRSLARHDAGGTLADFARAAQGAVTARGQVLAVLPVARAGELTAAMARGGFGLRRQVSILSRPGVRPQRMLLAFARRPARASDPVRRQAWVVHARGGSERFASPLRPWIEEGRARA